MPSSRASHPTCLPACLPALRDRCSACNDVKLTRRSIEDGVARGKAVAGARTSAAGAAPDKRAAVALFINEKKCLGCAEALERRCAAAAH